MRGRGSRFPAGAGRGLGGDLPGLAPSDGGFCPPPFFALAASSRPPPPRLDAYEGNPRGRQSSKGCQPRAFHRLRGLPGTTLHSCPGVDGSKAAVFHARGVSPRCILRESSAGLGVRRPVVLRVVVVSAQGGGGRRGLAERAGAGGWWVAWVGGWLGAQVRDRGRHSPYVAPLHGPIMPCGYKAAQHGALREPSFTFGNQYMVSAMKMALGGAFARYVFSRAVQRAVQSRAV